MCKFATKIQFGHFDYELIFNVIIEALQANVCRCRAIKEKEKHDIAKSIDHQPYHNIVSFQNK